MAITAIEYALITKLNQAGVLRPNPDILELGEANWYGDVPIDRLASDVNDFVADPARRQALASELQSIVQRRSPKMLFEMAKVFYKVFLDYGSITAIDFHGTEVARKCDLNQPIELDRQYDIVMNGGTAEHVFNVYQFFETAHKATKAGGLMLHGVPFTGWYDHGFYNFNPTFFFDLAEQNGYKLLMLVCAKLQPLELIQIHKREQTAAMAREEKIGHNALLYAIMQKDQQERPFSAPIQGYYSGAISEEASEAWRDLR